VTLPASPRAATEQAIAEAFKRMAPDDYKPMPDRPVEFWNARFQPHRQDEAAAARGALADGEFYSDGE
jgi:hypothetical protein